MKNQFYTFYDFTYNRGYPPFRALTQSQLKRKISKLSELYKEWSKVDFVRHFRQIVLDNSQLESERRLAHWHLVAYIDKSRCYLIWREYCHIPFYAAQSEKFYGITNEVLFNLDKFKRYLGKYDFQHQSKASFTTYILGILRNSIKEKLDDLESDWHLLCNVDTSSTRRIKNVANKLREALKRYGISEPRISQYIFAWQYFVPIYKKNNVYLSGNSTSRWKNPEDSDFVETTNYYNRQKNQPNEPLQVSSSLEATPEIIREWMETCIQALRQYRKIAEVSRNSDNYDEGKEIDIVFSFTVENDDLLVEVEQVLQAEINNIEVNLPSIHKKVSLQASRAIMPLYYPRYLAIFNQQQLAEWLGVNQGTISRYISNQIQKPLLKRFQNLLTNKFDIVSYLDGFLEKRFNNPNNILDHLLNKSFYDLEEQQKRILKLKYGENKTISEINTLLSDGSIDRNQIQEIKQKLKIVFQKKIEKWQKSYIKLWLQKYYENQVKEVLVQGFTQLNKLQKEVLKKQYCEKLDRVTLSSLYPKYQVKLIIEEANKQLKDFLLEWFNNSFNTVLQVEDSQIIEIIETWLSRELLYLDI